MINGLDEIDLDVLSHNISSMGFNCVRLPYSIELYKEDPVVENSSVSANPHLFGLTGMEIFDKTVESLTNAGLMVILDNHVSDAIWCCSRKDGNGMWANPYTKYTYKDWHDSLLYVAKRYNDNKMVVGFDLRNEIRDDLRHGLKPNWGKDDMYDWEIESITAAC